jgi:hypothetical protein
MDNISLHVKTFNDRVKVMNQTGKKDLTLTANDARNLHSDIFALLALVAELSGKLQLDSESNNIQDIWMDGGGFK